MNPSIVRKCGVAILAIAVLAVQGVWATTHVVQFGGSLGFIYSPSSFNATVGDTVKWEGDFSVHPLVSTSVPSGAQTFSASSGSSFSYHIAVAGSYAFHCTVHFSIGMAGTFTATQSSVRYNSQPPRSIHSEDIQLSIKEVSGLPLVGLSVPRAGQVTLELFDITGRKQATVLNRIVLPGSYLLPLGAQNMPGGFYFVKVTGMGMERVTSFFMAR